MTAALPPQRRHDIRWFAPAPLWTGLLDADPADLARPVLLRIHSDDFMADLAAALDGGPDALLALQATPRSYRSAPPGAPDTYTVPIDHVKLFQPVHGHFNLVAASLACRTVGLPDRGVDAAREITSFVLRRVVGDDEYAWTADGWVPATGAHRFVPGERQIPLFPVVYRPGGSGPPLRRLHVGLIPTASTETARAGALPMAPGPDDPLPPDGRPDELVVRVVEPLRGLADAEAVRRVEVSRFVLLDLADFLDRHAPALWLAVQQRQRPASGPAMVAYDLLAGTAADAALSWIDALLAVWAERERIWLGTGALTDIDLTGGPMAPGLLRARIVGALPALSDDQRRIPPPDPPKLDPRPAVRYVVRCAYTRPHCGPLHPELLSEPTRPFAIASYFDLDAPARPIRIPLPLDTSIAGLRAAPKNVSVLISRELRGQMARVAELNRALKGELGSAQSFDLGQICSFSIPIITICALLLLLMIVGLLNIVFFWLPLFRICVPIQLKGRE